MTIETQLESHPLIQGRPECLQALLARGEVRGLGPQEVLYEPGDPATAFFLVLEGEVEAFMRSGDERIPVWVYGQGQAFGEHALLRSGDDGRVRTTGMRARSAATLFRVPRATFQEVLSDRFADRRTGDTREALAIQRVLCHEALGDLVVGGDPQGVSLSVYAPGEAVILSGEPADAAYFILEGEARAHRDGELLSTMVAGQCFGELAVLDGKPRSASVVADTRLLVLRLPAEVFARWAAEDPRLRTLLALQAQVYRGPQGRTVTTVHAGTYEGRPCRTSVVRYADGRHYSATRLDDRAQMIWTELSQPAAEVRTVESRVTQRRLHLDASDRIMRIEAEGALDDIDRLVLRLISRRPLKPALEDRFRNTGTLDKPRSGELLCACVGLTWDDARTLDPQTLRGVTGAGRVCGGCEPKLVELGVPSRGEATSRRSARAETRTGAAIEPMPYRRYVEKVLAGEIELPKASELVARLRQRHPQAFEPRPGRTVRALVGLCARLGLTAFALWWATAHQQLWWVPVLLVIQAVNYYGIAALGHDLAHGAGFQRDWINRLLGGLLLLPMAARFGAFRRSHLQHHLLNQSFDDPKIHPPASVTGRSSGTVRRWFAALPGPIVDLVVVVLVLIGTAPLMLIRYDFGAFVPIRNREDWVEVLGLAAFWVGLPWLLGWPAALVVLFVPWLLGYACMVPVFFTHTSRHTVKSFVHDEKDYELMLYNITNLSLGRLVDRLSYDFHRFHVEHHLCPTLPFHRLAEISPWVRSELGGHLLPVQRLTFGYVRRGFVDAILDPRCIELAGRRLWVGPYFDEQRFPGFGAEPSAPRDRS